MRITLGLLAMLMGCSGSSFDVGESTVDSAFTDGTPANDSASADSTADSAVTPDALVDGASSDASEAGPKCSDPTTFPKFDKGCTNDESCTYGLHQTDCCGSQVVIGFNHAYKDSFDTAEKAWRATCPACGCPPAPTKADDGKTGTSFGVRCSSGMCTTYAN